MISLFGFDPSRLERLEELVKKVQLRAANDHHRQGLLEAIDRAHHVLVDLGCAGEVLGHSGHCPATEKGKESGRKEVAMGLKFASQALDCEKDGDVNNSLRLYAQARLALSEALKVVKEREKIRRKQLRVTRSMMTTKKARSSHDISDEEDDEIVAARVDLDDIEELLTDVENPDFIMLASKAKRYHQGGNFMAALNIYRALHEDISINMTT